MNKTLKIIDGTNYTNLQTFIGCLVVEPTIEYKFLEKVSVTHYYFYESKNCRGKWSMSA